MYNERFYRDWIDCGDLKQFQVAIAQSDLFILCDQYAKEQALEALANVRKEIEGYIAINRSFETALEPVPVERDAPVAVRKMDRAARAWNVGPMASVAGTVSECVGKRLIEHATEVIVENGGDIFAVALRPLKFILYAGENSPFKDKLAFKIHADNGIGVCTSSGKVGPSLSFGAADAVVAIAEDAAFADAAATAIANSIKTPEDIDVAVEEQNKRGDLKGLIACCGERLGVWGDIEIIRR